MCFTFSLHIIPFYRECICKTETGLFPFLWFNTYFKTMDTLFYLFSLLWESQNILYYYFGTPLQRSCLENPMDGGDWWAAVHAVARSQTRLSDFTSTFHFHALEKEMATQSSVFAWRIPRMAEPGGLPSVGLHRVGHDWSDLAAVAAAVFCLSQDSVLFFSFFLFNFDF